MTRSDLDRQLAQYADGEVEPAGRALLEQHLAAHPEDREVVGRWRELRACLRRVVSATPVPAGLAERVRMRLDGGGPLPADGPVLARGRDGASVLAGSSRGGARHELSRRRLWRVGASGLGLAAVMFLGFTLWPRGAAATPVNAAGFAAVYQRCAVEHGHDALGLCGQRCCECSARIRERCGFDCALPDVGRCGRYKLAGGCPCPPAKGLRTVHTFYRPDAQGPVVSVFALERRIRLCTETGDCAARRKGQRKYAAAQTGAVAVVTWHEGNRSYALCSEMHPEQLMQLAEEIRNGPAAASRLTR